ncbi:MAG: hypothetical protein ACOX52_21340 [Verrucomicrobiota bacterium]
MTLPTPVVGSEPPWRLCASARESPDPDGEVSRRDRRGVLGGGKGTYIGAVFNN